MSFQLLSITHPIARKAHRCLWCPEPIRAGEVYDKIVGIYDGKLDSGKYHHECFKAMQTLPYGEENPEPAQCQRGTTLETNVAYLERIKQENK